MEKWSQMIGGEKDSRGLMISTKKMHICVMLSIQPVMYYGVLTVFYYHSKHKICGFFLSIKFY